MVNKTTLAKTAALTFGAAMATMHAAPDLNASIVTINFNPGSLAYSSFAGTNVSLSTSGGNIGTFSQWNDNIGKTLNFQTAGLSSWTLVTASQSLAASTFSGTATNLFFGASSSGTVYVGFRTLAGNVGWFAMNLGGAGGTIVWGPGEYGNSGETVHVGAAAIPEPAGAGLALLALGAAGLRRRRKN